MKKPENRMTNLAELQSQIRGHNAACDNIHKMHVRENQIVHPSKDPLVTAFLPKIMRNDAKSGMTFWYT